MFRAPKARNVELNTTSRTMDGADNAHLCEAELEDVSGEEREQHQTLPPQLQSLEIQCFLLCPDKGHREAELEDASDDEREEHQTWKQQHNRDIDHLVEEHTQNGRVKLVQELHLRNLHRDPKQLRNLHSCLHCHDQALVVEQQQMSSTRPRTASVGSRRTCEQ